MPKSIMITEREYFAFDFIKNHDGKGIPSPLPSPVKSLADKGLVKLGERLIMDGKVRCYLTPLGKICFKK